MRYQSTFESKIKQTSPHATQNNTASSNTTTANMHTKSRHKSAEGILGARSVAAIVQKVRCESSK